MKQGDCLSPTLFSVFINDLAEEIKESGVGVHISGQNRPPDSLDPEFIVNILLYADDIVVLAETEVDLQQLLNIIERWCSKWRLEVNLSKTNILHVRGKRKPRSDFVFLFGGKPVPYCSEYRYLGVTINEYLDYGVIVDHLTDSAGRALGAIIAKMIKFGGFPYRIFSMLYDSCIVSIADYSAAVTGSVCSSLKQTHTGSALA